MVVSKGEVSLWASPQGFKTRLVGRDFHTLIRNVLFLSPTNVGSHNPLLLGPEFSLAHHLVSDSDTIHNSSSPDNPFLAFSRGFKTHMLGRGFHTLVRYVSFPSPTDVGSHNPLPLGASVLASTPSVSGSNTICNSSSPPLADIVLFGLSLLGFPSRF